MHVLYNYKWHDSFLKRRGMFGIKNGYYGKLVMVLVLMPPFLWKKEIWKVEM